MLRPLPVIPSLRAVEPIRRLRGGSQSHLMRASDGRLYVVKFRNNPQHPRILVNELLATLLAARIGLPTAPVALMEISGEFIERNPSLYIELTRGRTLCLGGCQFASRYLGSPIGTAADLLNWPEGAVENAKDFIGMLLFDKWTCNTDGRQVVFVRQRNSSTYRIHMIDQGFCFDGGRWCFPDGPIRSLYCNRRVYAGITGLESFEPWLSRLQADLTLDAILETASQVPSEWLEPGDALLKLVQRLDRRRKLLSQLLFSMRDASPLVFNAWKTPSARVSGAHAPLA